MKKRTGFLIFLIATILYLLCICTAICCYGSETKKKNISQMTSKEIKIRNQNFKNCIQSGTSRSRCRLLYY